jgi:predicted metal-dependent HD superfamily phosphohydrolase
VSREFYEPKFEIDPRFLWREFVKRAGGHPQVADDGFTILMKLYGEPHRAYHTMAHISWCLDLLREAFPEGSRPDWYDRMELALWFHDCVYDPHRKDNEERSARVMIGCSAMLGFPPKLADEAAKDVEATTHTEWWVERELPTQWVLDIDLASLGFAPEVFDKNSVQIREEFSFVPEAVFMAGRKTILQGFLGRPRIYLTNECYEKFEFVARANLKRAIAALE